MKRIINLFLNKEFILFVFIGVLNTFNGTIFSYFYSSLFNENFAFILGYISGLIIAYFLNSFITFKETIAFKKFIKFAIAYIPNFIIQNLTVILVFNVLGYHQLIAYVSAAAIAVPITFLILKVFAFKKETTNQEIH